VAAIERNKSAAMNLLEMRRKAGKGPEKVSSRARRYMRLWPRIERVNGLFSIVSTLKPELGRNAILQSEP
jgi:hypothetical protein